MGDEFRCSLRKIDELATERLGNADMQLAALIAKHRISCVLHERVLERVPFERQMFAALVQDAAYASMLRDERRQLCISALPRRSVASSST